MAVFAVRLAPKTAGREDDLLQQGANVVFEPAGLELRAVALVRRARLVDQKFLKVPYDVGRVAWRPQHLQPRLLDADRVLGFECVACIAAVRQSKAQELEERVCPGAIHFKLRSQREGRLIAVSRTNVFEALIHLLAVDILLHPKLVARARDHGELIAELRLQLVELGEVTARRASVRRSIQDECHLALEAVDGQVGTADLRQREALAVKRC